MIRILFLSLSLVVSNFVFSGDAPVFNKELNKNRIFVETGSYEGAGIERALKAGYEIVHSIEVSRIKYDFCKNKFKGNSNVHLWLGNSRNTLPQIMKTIREPVTFWLDAHLPEKGSPKNTERNPILNELQCIKNHPIKTHTIMIDDMRCLRRGEYPGISVDTLVKKVTKINPNYHV